MEVFFREIEKKLKKEINIEIIRIIDNSYKHSTHKFFDKDKFHLKLIISSKELLKIQRPLLKIFLHLQLALNEF